MVHDFCAEKLAKGRRFVGLRRITYALSEACFIGLQLFLTMLFCSFCAVRISSDNVSFIIFQGRFYWFSKYSFYISLL